MNILDLFSGIGGFSLAAQRAGFEIDKHYASEIDKYAQMIYRRNFNGSIQLGDVTGIGNELGKIDIITGGFPCQAFSIAGKRRGFEDTRGTLFFEIERLCRFYRPSYMVLENVKGLASHEGGDTIRVILDKLRGLNYSVQLLLLNTKDFGIPQNRERFFFICTARGKRQPEISGIRERKTEITPDNLEIYKKSGEKKKSTIAATLTGGAHSGGNHSDMDYIKVGTLRTHKDGEGFREMQSGLCPTIPARAREDGSGQPIISYQRCFSKQYSKKTEETGTLQSSRIDKVPMIIQTPRGYNEGGVKETCPTITKNSFEHNNHVCCNEIIRRLTPIECERLQDFPDDWTKYGITEEGKEVEISDTQRYKTCGNSITVKVAEEIFKEIRKVYDDIEQQQAI